MHAQLLDTPQTKVNELNLMEQVRSTLEKHYPGGFWLCGVNQSVIIIRNTLLAGDAGYVIHIPMIYSASWLEHEVMVAGGTILEAYRQQRGKMRLDQVIGLPTDFAGNHYVPAGAMKTDKRVRSEVRPPRDMPRGPALA
jgi:hypothetical protein